VVGVIPATRIVVLHRFRGLTPEIPAAFTNRATRLRPTWIPCSRRSSAWSLGAPYTLRLASWISLIFSTNNNDSRKPTRKIEIGREHRRKTGERGLRARPLAKAKGALPSVQKARRRLAAA
jgi:hypothetical protein